MKNSNPSTYLLSMLVLVSLQVNASLETWGQKLDLTIPSLETPSTSVLDSRDKQEIMMGWTCCYQKKHIDSVRLEHLLQSTEFSLRENQKKLIFTPRFDLADPPSNLDWTLFVTLQLLDVYTTLYGLKYECVEEANPLFGENPTPERLFFYKVGLLTPALEYDRKHGNLNKASIRGTNSFMTLVIGNNVNVIHKAKKSCKKR